MSCPQLKKENCKTFLVIPEFLVSNFKLTDAERLTAALIISLTKKTGYCFASNEYLKQNRNIGSIRTIQRHLRKLEDLKLLKIVVLNRNTRRIYVNDTTSDNVSYVAFIRFQNSKPIELQQI